MRNTIRFSLWAAVALLPAAGRARADEAPGDVTRNPPYETFLVLPLRVHVLQADGLPEIDCKLTDEDVRRVVGKVNGIWNRAGIHWALGEIVREPAARTGRFRLARDLDGPRNLGVYRLLVPEESFTEEGMHVYYIHRFPVNGVWLGDGVAVVQETARLREVEGGIDEPLPRVTAHELGHGLGLSHRQARTNLLASGTTGTLLNTSEVETARVAAQKVPGVRTVDELKADAEKAASAGDTAKAKTLWRCLDQVPGSGDAPRKALESLDAGR